MYSNKLLSLPHTLRKWSELSLSSVRIDLFPLPAFFASDPCKNDYANGWAYEQYFRFAKLLALTIGATEIDGAFLIFRRHAHWVVHNDGHLRDYNSTGAL